MPGDVPHTFANQADEPARFLLACMPGGFEAYFRALAEGGDADTIARVSAENGYRVVGEPTAAG